MRRFSHGAVCATALLSLGLAAPSARAAGEPIMGLGEVQAGMVCQASTVISGLEPVNFEATVISVEGGPRPIDAGIVMRFAGDAVAGTGIASGFSGSPVRCPRADGSLAVIGAIAYGIGQYDNLVGQVTPIEAMLAMPPVGEAPGAPAIGVAAPDDQTSRARSGKSPKSTGSRARRSADALPPVISAEALRRQIPLTLSGPRGPLAEAFKSAAAKAGKRLLVSPLATRSQAPGGGLKPGDAVAATSVFGDVSAGAIGTVTYVDGDRVYAFGHPSNGTGPSRQLMERARISTVIASPTIGEQASYKLGTAIGPVGTFGFDGASGIAGLLGPVPGSIPVTATVRDAGGAMVEQARANVVDERAIRGGNTGNLLALAAGSNAGTALQRLTTQPSIGGSARACTTIHLTGGEKPLVECIDSIVIQPGTEGGVETGVAESVAAAVSPLADGERFLRLVDRVDVEVRFRREADTAEVVKISAPTRPRPGREATIRVTVVQGSTGERRVIPIKVRIPKYAAGQRTGIVVLADAVEGAPEPGSDDLEVIFEDEADSAAPKTLKALRALYSPAGVSGLRAVSIPGLAGADIRGGIEGDEESELDESDLAEIARRTKLVFELPSVRITGSASATVTVARR